MAPTMFGYTLVVNCRCTVCTSSMDLQGLEESSLGIRCRRGSLHADMVVRFFWYSPANNLKRAIIRLASKTPFKCHFCWRANDGPTLNAGWEHFWQIVCLNMSLLSLFSSVADVRRAAALGLPPRTTVHRIIHSISRMDIVCIISY